MNRPSNSIVPRNRRYHNKRSIKNTRVFTQILQLPAPDAPLRCCIALSLRAETRIRRNRRTALLVPIEPDPIRIRPHGNPTFVHTRRISDDGNDHADHITSDYACDCMAGRMRGSVPCIHRRALQSIGGAAGYYAQLARTLRNSLLLQCCKCSLLLDAGATLPDDLHTQTCVLCAETEPLP